MNAVFADISLRNRNPKNEYGGVEKKRATGGGGEGYILGTRYISGLMEKNIHNKKNITYLCCEVTAVVLREKEI